MTIILHTLLFFFSPSLLPAARAEVVGEVRIENFKNNLIIDAMLDKGALTVAMSEVDCEPQDMIKKCGQAYFWEHFTIYVNGRSIHTTKLSMEIQEESVLYHFEWNNTTPIRSIEVTSDYMLRHHKHSELNVLINVDDVQKDYSLKAETQEISFTANQPPK